MGRANAIVVGSAVLAPLLLGVEGFALFRPHHRPPPPAEMADLPAAAVPRPAPLPVAPPPEAPPPVRRTVAPAAPPPPEQPAAAEEPAEAPADPTTVARWRELMAHQRQVVRDADEKVFDVLNLPDAQRTAIRAIDEQYARALQSIETSSGLAPGVDLNANQTRRAAIIDVLGADGMHAFTFEERKAQRRVRGQLRAQSLRGQ